MNTYWPYCIVVLAAVATCLAETGTEDFDINAVINDENKLKEYVYCFIDKGPCDSYAGVFKKDLPEAIHKLCSDCSNDEKHWLNLFHKALKEKLPADYQLYKAKYDPDNKYFEGLEAAIANS